MLLTQGTNPALFEDFGNELFRKVIVYTISAYVVKHCLSGDFCGFEFTIQVTYSEGVWVEKLEMKITDGLKRN